MPNIYSLLEKQKFNKKMARIIFCTSGCGKHKRIMLRYEQEIIKPFTCEECLLNRKLKNHHFEKQKEKLKEEEIKVELEKQKEVKERKKMRYDKYLKIGHWQNVRSQALKRANFHCQLCGNHNYLQVHHNSYEHRGDERLDELVVLCNECHEKFHGIKN